MTERTPLADIGEARISLEDKSFFFKPSFSAMSKIGSGSEIVDIYASLNGIDYIKALKRLSLVPEKSQQFAAHSYSKSCYGRHVLSAAYVVIQSCCDDDVSILIGSWKPTPAGVRYIKGLMPIAVIIEMAKMLMEHGLMGKSPLKVPQKSGNKSSTTNEFNISQYILSARTHFKMTRDEAEDLTMTEFQMMIKNKYPEPEGITKEQHKELYDDAKVMREKLAAKMAKKKGLKNGTN